VTSVQDVGVEMSKAIAALKQARDALDEAIATLEALARNPQSGTDSAKVIEILDHLKSEPSTRRRTH
jgi:hypothetical protein